MKYKIEFNLNIPDDISVTPVELLEEIKFQDEIITKLIERLYYHLCPEEKEIWQEWK